MSDFSEIDEDGFLFDGTTLTVMRGQHPGSFYSAHLFYLAQSFAERSDTSIVRDEEGYPLVGLVHAPRGEEHRHEQLLWQIEWVVARVLRGLVTRAIRATESPLRVLITGFRPFEDDRGDWVPHNVTEEWVAAPSRIRSVIRYALTDVLAPTGGPEEPISAARESDTLLHFCLYHSAYRLGRPLTVIARTLPMDEGALSKDPSQGLVGMLEHYRPQVVLLLGLRPRGLVEFTVEEVSDNSGLLLEPAPHHSVDAHPTRGHPLNRAAARAFTQGLSELGRIRE
ncbi:MAG: hypothetical protein AAFX94_20990 [Myxococcota bacterium]